MPQWLNRFSEFEHTSQADDNRMHANNCQGNLNTAGWVAVYPSSIVSVFEQIGSQT